MRVAELLDILRGYPKDWEIELAVVFPAEESDDGDEVDRYSIEAVMPWKVSDQTRMWLVGGDDDNVDAFLDKYGDA